MACNVTHPEHPQVRCLAKDGRTHDQHFAMHAGQPLEWKNEDWVAPPPKTRRSRGSAAQALKDLADKVPPKQSVDRDVMAIGEDHPETSHKMRERKIGKTGTQRRLIYDLALSRGEHGLTDDEAEMRLGLLHQSASAARNSLMKDGWLLDTGVRRRTRSGEEAIAWVAHPGG